MSYTLAYAGLPISEKTISEYTGTPLNVVNYRIKAKILKEEKRISIKSLKDIYLFYADTTDSNKQKRTKVKERVFIVKKGDLCTTSTKYTYYLSNKKERLSIKDFCDKNNFTVTGLRNYIKKSEIIRIDGNDYNVSIDYKETKTIKYLWDGKNLYEDKFITEAAEIMNIIRDSLKVMSANSNNKISQGWYFGDHNPIENLNLLPPVHKVNGEIRLYPKKELYKKFVKSGVRYKTFESRLSENGMYKEEGLTIRRINK